MKKNKFVLQIVIFGLIILSFIACETDYANLDSDVVNSDVSTSFRIESEPSDVITYTKLLGPVQTNTSATNASSNLSTLGIYDDVYGRTTAGFVSQFTLSSYDPDFGDDPIIDSVVVTMPFFSTVTEVDDDNGNITYEVDSILPKGVTYKDIKLRIFENNYFIRDFDPSADFDESQAYFSNKSASETEMITNLEGQQLAMIADFQTSYLVYDDNKINITNKGFVLEEPDTDEDDDTDPQITERQAPGIRIKLDPNYWKNKIIDKEGDAVLSSKNNFTEYFRGLYFKAETVGNDGSFLILNTSSSNANITIYYTSATDVVDEREEATVVLNFGSNKINFLHNDFTLPMDTPNPITGDSRLYLKGGEGSIAGIKLFDGVDEFGVTNFENFRKKYVTLKDGEYESSKLLVNEANLVFYVDQDIVQDSEPNRLFLYDMDNKSPLIDYFLDGINNTLPSYSLLSHLGPLQYIDDDPTNAPLKYKFRITEHINNLLLRDSANVELGLSVSLNVNLESSTTQREVQNTDDYAVPESSVISPRGIVLHGNTTENESKRVYLEIFYTEPNN